MSAGLPGMAWNALPRGGDPARGGRVMNLILFGLLNIIASCSPW